MSTLLGSASLAARRHLDWVAMMSDDTQHALAGPPGWGRRTPPS